MKHPHQAILKEECAGYHLKEVIFEQQIEELQTAVKICMREQNKKTQHNDQLRREKTQMLHTIATLKENNAK